MKQYDRIYVRNHLPQSETEYILCKKGVEHPLLGLGNVNNVIVLTLEELKELWESASTMPALPGVFELYLKSKGIEL